MANPGSASGSGGRKGRRPASGFKPTLRRLKRDVKHEARFRLLLLSILLVLLLVFSAYLVLPRLLPQDARRDDPDQDSDWISWVVCSALLFFVARIWSEVRRCGLRIAEMQNISYHVQFIADRWAAGIEVTQQEWQVFEEVTRLLKVVSRLQKDEAFHPLLALLAKIRLDQGSPGRDSADASAVP